MSTGNFHNVNASKVFAVEVQEEWDYDDLVLNIGSELDFRDFGKDVNELRSYPSKCIGTLDDSKEYADFSANIELVAIVRSGYYSGVNLDWGIRYEICGDWFDELDERDIADTLEYQLDYSRKLAERKAEYVVKWAEANAPVLVDKLETIYENYSTPLNVVGRFSNGEVVYEEAGSTKSELKCEIAGGNN